MNIRLLFGAKAYFIKMVLWISMAILILVVVLSTVVYINSQNLLVKNEYAANQKILYQVKYNMDFMDQTISNLSKFLYLNSDVTAVMYAKQENMVDVAYRLNKIVSSVTSANPYIHSISIYNRNLDQSYSTGSPLFFKDQMLYDFINSNKALPKLKPIFRDIKKLVNGKTDPEHVFSYFVYETLINDAKPDGVVVINVKPEWLLENIKQINMIDKRKGDNVFILDQYGEYLDDGTNDREIMSWMKSDFMLYKTAHPQAEPDGFFQSKHNGIQYLVTFTNLDSAGMTLLKMQPVLEIYKYINSLKTSIIFITIIFLVMAIVMSIGISQKIYRPLGKLVNSIMLDRVRRLNKDEVVDEISYLNTVYQQSMEKLDHFDKEKYQYKDVMKHYWLSRLLTESFSIGGSELETIFQDMRFSISLDGSYVICLLKIDNYKEFQQTFQAKDKDTIRFALINIASEIVAREYPNEGLDMKDDHVVLIVSLPEEDDQFPRRIVSLMEEAQENVSRLFKVSFTASISDKANHRKTLHSLYNKALDQSMYRLLLGHSSVITHETVKKHVESKKTGYARNLEETFLETIKSRNAGALEEVLAHIFAEISTLNYHNALVSIIRLVDAGIETLEEMKVTTSPSLHISSISRNILEKETIVEIHRIIVAALHDSLQQGQGETTNSLNYFVVDAVTEYIHNHYQDPSLSLTSIASIMKLSTRNLSKIYKEATQISIPDCINEFRLAKAAELLIHEDLSVYEVVEKVGILNETYFFSMFKKKYKVTPKEYAIRRNMNNLNNKG
ncbi:AraC family transcriptional regulator [Paenibacillus sp. HWE-109]|uniref:AraC family transcriptional regulator n=1 Tax=Paenibacillus sp. HWE-109 TaxID=1306526 RepID=UPI001EDDB68A|nr:helix-turn-helix domain-containing protein [Paenibacillus sp. HWE-109]UKS24377.1 AraC family transcriptional regulator [Paenibacillus sp. HWE-109]